MTATNAMQKVSRSELELMLTTYRQHADAWQTRALLAEAQLAVLKSEYEPEGTEPCS
jgi:hypothetical protein